MNNHNPEAILKKIMDDIASEDLKIESDNVKAHYLINKKLNPNKDRQSLRAAIASKDEAPDKNDVEEALGYKLKWRSLNHLIFLLENDLPELSNFNNKEIVEWVSQQLDGKPKIGVRKIERFRKEGNLSLKVVDHIYNQKNKNETSLPK